MNPFEFHNPTRIIYGPDTTKRIGEFAGRYGKRALVVTTRGSIVRLGIYECVTESAENAGVKCFGFFGVDPNPRISTVLRGVQACKDNDIDMIVAVGGGSVIDCAKAIAFCVDDDGDGWDFFNGTRKPKRALPVLVVLTLSGTGSEMNANCVITNEALGQKYVTNCPLVYPAVSIIDPNLMASVPKYLTACGMVDTISHVLEKYFDGVEDTPIQDRIAEGVVLTVIENESVLENLGNVAQRGNLAWASTIALNNMTNVGRGFGAFDAHTIELEVSAKYDVAHGAGLAAVHPAWMRHLCKKSQSKFVQFAARVFGLDVGGMSDLDAGMAGIDALVDKFRSWGMPTTLKEMNVPKEDLAGLAAAAVRSPKGAVLDEREVYHVLLDCYE